MSYNLKKLKCEIRKITHNKNVVKVLKKIDKITAFRKIDPKEKKQGKEKDPLISVSKQGISW